MLNFLHVRPQETKSFSVILVYLSHLSVIPTERWGQDNASDTERMWKVKMSGGHLICISLIQ